jgi:hypothetical protein
VGARRFPPVPEGFSTPRGGWSDYDIHHTPTTVWYRCSMTLSSTSTAHLLPRPPPRQGDGRCQASPGATVKHQLKPCQGSGDAGTSLASRCSSSPIASPTPCRKRTRRIRSSPTASSARLPRSAARERSNSIPRCRAFLSLHEGNVGWLSSREACPAASRGLGGSYLLS